MIYELSMCHRRTLCIRTSENTLNDSRWFGHLAAFESMGSMRVSIPFGHWFYPSYYFRDYIQPSFEYSSLVHAIRDYNDLRNRPAARCTRADSNDDNDDERRSGAFDSNTLLLYAILLPIEQRNLVVAWTRRDSQRQQLAPFSCRDSRFLPLTLIIKSANLTSKKRKREKDRSLVFG